MPNPFAARVEETIRNNTYKWWVLVVVQSSILLVGIDSTIVNLALPTIAQELKVSVTLAQWVIAAFFITTALSLPAAGRLADMLGRKIVFVGGFAVFTLGSVLCGVAPNAEILIAMRVLQAVGGAALLANSNVITLAVFPHQQHGLAMGINGTVYSVGYALGFTLGGWFISALGWRSIFLINLPIGIFAIALGLVILIESRLTFEKKYGQSFDYIGLMFSVLAIGGLMIGMEGWANHGDLNGLRLTLLLIGAVSLFLFILAELRSPCPLLDVRLFHIRLFSIGTFTRFLNNGIVASCSFLIPFYTQVALGFSPAQSGLLMLPFSLSLAFCGPLAGRLSDQFGARWMTSGAFLSGGLALFWLSTLQPVPPGASVDLTIAHVVLGMFFLGAASGFFVSPNNSITLDAVPSHQTGAASGCLWCMSFLGAAVGTAFSAAMLHHGENLAGGRQALQYHGAGGVDRAMESLLLRQQTEVFHFLMIFSVIGCVTCFLRGTGSREEKKA
jgi:EmrB/QacA subfamily drug resistance transporter